MRLFRAFPCSSRSATAAADWAMTWVVWLEISATSLKVWLIFSLEADCSSAAAAMDWIWSEEVLAQKRLLLYTG